MAPAPTHASATTKGLIQWTGTGFQACRDGSNWEALGSGSTTLLGTSATQTNPRRTDDATTGLFSDTATTISIATAGLKRVVVDSSGNVGIGIAVPVAQLHVGADATVGRIYVAGLASGANPLSTARPTVDTAQLVIGRSSLSEQAGGIEFISSPANAGYGWKITAPDTTASSGTVDLRILRRSNSATWTEAMRIENTTGKVGINNSNPAFKLDVNGNARFTSNTFVGYDEGVSGGLLLAPIAGYGKPAVQAIDANFAPADLLLNPVGTNVGIATATPTATLDVNGTGKFSGLVTATATPTAAGHLANKAYVDSKSSSGPSGLVGMIAAFYKSPLPTGWVECNGQTVASATYPALVQYLTGSATATSATMPDFRGYFLRGVNTSASGVDPSRTLGSIQGDALGSHTHTGTTNSDGASTPTTSPAGAHTHTVKGATGTADGIHISDDNSNPQGGNHGTATTSSAGDHAHTVTVPAHAHTFTTGAAGSTETRPDNIAVIYGMRAE